MIESGVGSPSLDQIVALAALAVMTKAAYSLGKAYSPGRGNGNSEKPGEEAELLRDFSRYPSQLQKGMLAYAERMRRSYSKKPPQNLVKASIAKKKQA